MTESMISAFRRCAVLLPLVALLLGLAAPAEAGVVARVSLSSQRMDVFVDGHPMYSWPVSTARRGYRTPTGTFRPQALAVWHRSTIYSGSPMPHAIFFHGGYAIHGSYETAYLGRPASHGCVRLHPAAAAELFSLVRQHGSKNTVIKITY
jgi:lipoprotein-anchoring transpeptidase ErfK/SrfK